MRAFVAIDMPDAVRDALERLQDDLQVGRLMAPETFHLTLAFLGEQPGAVLESVHDELCEIRAAPMPLHLDGVEVFGGEKPKILWAGAEGSAELNKLRDRVRRAAATAGIDLPRERFRPHVTLARFSGRFRGDEAEKLHGFLARNGGFGLPPFQVDRIKMYSSILEPDGALHEVLAEYPLV